MSFFSDLWAALRGAVADFSQDRCMQAAAALSYYTVFALPALLVVVVFIAGLFLDPRDVQGGLHKELQNTVGESAGAQIQTMVANTKSASQGILGTLIVVGSLLIAATGLLLQLQDALNVAWDVPTAKTGSGVRRFLWKRLVSLAMVLAIGLLLLASVVLSTFLSAVGDQLTEWLPAWLSRGALVGLDVGLSFLLFTVAFAAMYKFLPDAEVQWRSVWVGGVLTAALFIVGKWLLGLYFSYRSVGSAFGAAGSLALILVWVYYSGMIVLLGAEFTQAWARRRGDAKSRRQAGAAPGRLKAHPST